MFGTNFKLSILDNQNNNLYARDTHFLPFCQAQFQLEIAIAIELAIFLFFRLVSSLLILLYFFKNYNPTKYRRSGGQICHPSEL